MYSIVTRTIKEEHFEHPSTAMRGIQTHCGYGNISTQPAPAWTSDVYPDVITCPPTDGNLKVKTSSPYQVESDEIWGVYHTWGDLNVHGSLNISNNLTVEGAIVGRGTVNNVTLLETEPTGNTWPGQIGDLARTDSYMYLCVDTDTWIRWTVQSKW